MICSFRMHITNRFPNELQLRIVRMEISRFVIFKLLSLPHSPSSDSIGIVINSACRWYGKVMIPVVGVMMNERSPILKLCEWMHIIVNRCRSQLLINFLFSLYTCILLSVLFGSDSLRSERRFIDCCSVKQQTHFYDGVLITDWF